MTAPNYTDKDAVLSWSRKNISDNIDRVKQQEFRTVSGENEIQLCRMILNLWDARDSARETAAMQDEQIQKATIILLKLASLQKLGKALSVFTATGDICGVPLSETMKDAWLYVCDKGDSGEVMAERLGLGWQSLQEIEMTIAQVLEGLAGTTKGAGE